MAMVVFVAGAFVMWRTVSYYQKGLQSKLLLDTKGDFVVPFRDGVPSQESDRREVNMAVKPKTASENKYDRNNLLIHNCEDNHAEIHNKARFRKIDLSESKNVTDINWSDESDGIKCKYVHLNITQRSLNIPLCLYKPEVDTISKTILRGRVYEQDDVRNLARKLQLMTDGGLIDIGANIGVFTLMAASLNFPVLAVEPKAQNIRRIQKALSRLPNSSVTVIQNAVSDVRTTMHLLTNSREQGRTIVVCNELCTNTSGDICTSDIVDTVHMDDLLKILTFKKAIMKIDIEGHEIHAFAKSGRFFQVMDIRAILMEWNYRKSFQSKAESDRKEVEKFIGTLMGRGYRPQSRTGSPLGLTYWDKWPANVFFVK